MNAERTYQLEGKNGSEYAGIANGAADAVREGGADGQVIVDPTGTCGEKQGRREKALEGFQTVIRFTGGVSWIAGIYILGCLAAGVDQGVISGWQMAGMALAGIACLALTAVASRIEGRDEE